MSTGLTYVTLFDNDGSLPVAPGGIQIFANYDEAFKYGEWTSNRYLTAINVTIWTSGPNDNGVWYNGVFTVYP